MLEESFSTGSLQLSFSMSNRLPTSSSKFWWRWTIAIAKVSAIVTWSQRTSSSQTKQRTLTLKLLTSVCLRSSPVPDLNAWKQELALRTISLQRFSREAMTLPAICGLLAVCFISYYADIHLSMVMTTRRSSRWSRRVSSTLTVRSGTKFQTTQKILSKN